MKGYTMTTKTNEKVQASTVEVENWVTKSLSPYKLAPIVSDVVGRDIRPQILYAYVRNATLGLEVHLSETGHKVVTPEIANQFIANFIQRDLDRAAEEAAKAEEAKADEAAAKAEAKVANETN